jgi:tetratricopeptide (TPR) repeat protein
LEVLDNIYEQFAPEPFDPFAVLIAENTDPSGQREPSLRPALSPDTAALLESMLAFYDRLAEQNGNDSRFRRKAAQAKRRVGDIRQHLQQFDQAAAAYREAISIYQQLDETSDDPTIALETAQIHNEIGHMYPYIGQPEEAIQSHQQAVQLLESTHGEKYYPETRYELARAYFLLGRQGLWGATIGMPDGPHKLDDMPLRQGSGPNPHLRPASPPPKRIPSRKALDGSLPPPKHDPWLAADSLTSEEDTKQRLRNLDKAIDVLRELVRQPSHAPEHAALLAFVYHRAGVLEELTGNLDEAKASFANAVSVQSALVDHFPEAATYQLVLEQYKHPSADRRPVHDGPPGGPRRFGRGQRHRHEPTRPPGQFRPPPPP